LLRALIEGFNNSKGFEAHPKIKARVDTKYNQPKINAPPSLLWLCAELTGRFSIKFPFDNPSAIPYTTPAESSKKSMLFSTLAGV
jgi:hypothetical protein